MMIGLTGVKSYYLRLIACIISALIKEIAQRETGESSFLCIIQTGTPVKSLGLLKAARGE